MMTAQTATNPFAPRPEPTRDVPRAEARAAGAEPPTRSIVLMGKELRVKSDERPERLHELAAYVDDTIAQVGVGKNPQTPDQQLLLVALMRMADEVYKLRDEKRELGAILKRSTRTLLGRIPT